ncbi:hypothetical protein Tsubulata_027096 [Turnera subulata]|uniref:Uncharacterized protein n=1 Tax=Turnera subulata TaxID=218843 RepID=A0A9Q0J0F4_9ROSI|nr:hypothetical protein Tsubulata_027096 [Turnera subulata]
MYRYKARGRKYRETTRNHPHHIVFPQILHPRQNFVTSRRPPHGKPRTVSRRALREWQEYEDAVKRKDLSGALRFLKSKEALQDNKDNSIPTDLLPDLGWFADASSATFRDWEVLDTCLNADDMRLVAGAYGFLKKRGFLPNFGKFSSIVSKLSPKKWGQSGSSKVALLCFLGGVSLLLSLGIDIRVNLAALLGLAYADSIYLGGTCFAHISWVVQFGVYCMVLFAGIAAEALVYGEAEGGENDENLFRSISVLLQPPLSVAQMSNQARWSVLQSYNLLKWHKQAHRAAVKALETGNSLSVVIRRIEEAMSSSR